MGSESLEQIHGSHKPQQVACDERQQQDLAALEDGLKQLPPPSSCEFDAEGEDSADSGSGEAVVAASDADEVDSFLREALNSRNRLTVLRLEQEVEKFMRNSNQQQLQFKPMPSSYVRLAAHRVAQHYHLQSMVVDCNAPEGTTIVLRKTSDSRFPNLRLADIPLDPELQEKSVSAPLDKVAIKQRAGISSRANGYRNLFADGGRMNPMKTVEERKEEYNRARARIFSSVDVVGRAVEEHGVPDAVTVFKAEEKLPVNHLHDVVMRGEPASDGEGKVAAEDDFTLSVKLNSNRVAIFRDREKDKKDPDYDRSYDRYSQRFNPGFGVNIGPFSMHGIYGPVWTNNSEFPHLEGSRQLHARVDQASHITGQHLRGPWVGSTGSLGFGYPGAFFGQFTPGHISLSSGSDMYLQPPRLTRTAPYSYIEESFQHSSQPYLQPEASFREARR